MSSIDLNDFNDLPEQDENFDLNEFADHLELDAKPSTDQILDENPTKNEKS